MSSIRVFYLKFCSFVFLKSNWQTFLRTLDFCSPQKMEDMNNETDLEMRYNSEVSTGDKRKRESKLRSKVWQHFTKILKEDGKCDRCQCNHCHKLFSCSSRSGTTHLLRHVTDGICPVFRKDKEQTATISSYPRVDTGLLPWNFDQGLGQCSNEVDPLSGDNYGGGPTRTPLPPSRIKHSHQSVSKSQPKGEQWMNEFKNCVAKLVELTNGRIPVGPLQALAVTEPDYSISAAVKCLNEMEDIEKSSDMYLDAFEILQDGGERECFICLPSEPRRRWLQRVLHRRHPLRYASNL